MTLHKTKSPSPDKTQLLLIMLSVRGSADLPTYILSSFYYLLMFVEVHNHSNLLTEFKVIKHPVMSTCIRWQGFHMDHDWKITFPKYQIDNEIKSRRGTHIPWWRHHARLFWFFLASRTTTRQTGIIFLALTNRKFQNLVSFISELEARLKWTLDTTDRLRLCRMRQTYDRPGTWIVSCKSNLQLA